MRVDMLGVVAVFLKAHGTGAEPLPDRWLEHGSSLLDPGITAFPRRPRMVPGDRLIPLLSNAPSVEAIGVFPRSMSQQNHIRLEPRHLELAAEALAGLAR